MLLLETLQSLETLNSLAPSYLMFCYSIWHKEAGTFGTRGVAHFQTWLPSSCFWAAASEEKNIELDVN